MVEQRISVVVVSDEAEISSRIAGLLSSGEDSPIDIVSSGGVDEALETIERARVDVFVVDGALDEEETRFFMKTVFQSLGGVRAVVFLTDGKSEIDRSWTAKNGVLDSIPKDRLTADGLRRAIERSHEIASMQQKIEEQREDIEKLSPNDTLTGLLNRRAFMDRLIQEVERSQRYRLPLSLMALDIDRLGDINQLHGQGMGDIVIANAALQIQASVRTTDVAGRYGDDEFCVIMPETNLEGARVFAERLRAGIGSAEHRPRFEKPFSVTCSIGLTECTEETEGGLVDVLRRLDEALVGAKEQGGDRVVPPSAVDDRASESAA